ncbi:hypothetical protein GCM10018781_69310 [Kitasatospora indigofera]|uniref:Uncharacterized protein n=1 Tax=Kitasatospora indigofera TaxID=67307 RepID=A0A919GE96_9ACTN|nr:hypothetical protein GCM10018781_69310 [Kitasatospora indigofera]
MRGAPARPGPVLRGPAGGRRSPAGPKRAGPEAGRVELCRAGPTRVPRVGVPGGAACGRDAARGWRCGRSARRMTAVRPGRAGGRRTVTVRQIPVDCLTQRNQMVMGD